MEGEGFEPSKAKPSDLQSDPFDRSGTPPKSSETFSPEFVVLSTAYSLIINSFLLFFRRLVF
jgi:hypothetical protein